jgi:hypothetical protein
VAAPVAVMVDGFSCRRDVFSSFTTYSSLLNGQQLQAPVWKLVVMEDGSIFAQLINMLTFSGLNRVMSSMIVC